ncbi:hypothetical protein MMC08_006329 [Hypocenomyce scalaris]|nr:hypothetical protein [Hypocenomyce scalaris]
MRNILITGAGGFIGQALAASLLTSKRSHEINLTLTDINEPRNPSPNSNSEIRTIKADITSPRECDQLLDPVPDEVFLFHGIMSSGAEANLELGLKVNFNSVRDLLDRLRAINTAVRVVFTSTTAVYGPQEPGERVNEFNVVPYPRGSYGTEKLMVETLLNDYTRRGLIDGRICRLPTVVIRPGVPTAAASSFASGIVREPLKGVKSTLPVDPALKMWVCSPATVVANLMHVMDLPGGRYGDGPRTLNLPGITVSVAEILESLEKVAGKEVRNLVVEERNPEIEALVYSWPTHFDTALASKLGCKPDGTMEETIRRYMEENPIPNGH